MLFSCQENTSTIENESTKLSSKNIINFKGLSFDNRYSLSEKEVNETYKKGFKSALEKEKNKYYKSKGLSSKLQESFEDERLVQATVDMLPYLPFQEDGVNIEMIQRDIPNLSIEEYVEYEDVIDDYYNTTLDNLVARRYYDDTFEPYRLDELRYDDTYNTSYYTPQPPRIPIYKDAKLTGEDTETCVKKLANLKGIRVRRIVAAYTADRDAESNAKSYYPNLSTLNTKRDAFRHTIWQALLSKYYWTTSSK